MIVPAQHRGAGEQLMSSAKIKAVWTTAPSADAIRARDEENLVREIVAMADSPAEDDVAAARVLIAERSADILRPCSFAFAANCCLDPKCWRIPGNTGNQRGSTRNIPRLERRRLEPSDRGLIGARRTEHGRRVNRGKLTPMQWL